MGFMQPQIWKFIGLSYEDEDGSTVFCEDVSLIPPDTKEVEPVTGVAAMMSAPGYMDRTEVTVFDTVTEAVEFLREFYDAERMQVDSIEVTEEDEKKAKEIFGKMNVDIDFFIKVNDNSGLHSIYIAAKALFAPHDYCL